MLTFFCCCRGLECAGLRDSKITKQHEAYKRWMRSRPANTTHRDTRGDFVLDSPLAVSHLCSVFLFSSFALCTLPHCNCRSSKLPALHKVCHYMVGVKCRLCLKTTGTECKACRGLFVSPPSASLFSEFTVEICWTGRKYNQSFAGAFEFTASVACVLMLQLWLWQTCLTFNVYTPPNESC